jgi:uncharacterized protein
LNPSSERNQINPSRGLSPEAIRVIVRVVLFVAITWLGMAGFPRLIRTLQGAAAPILVVATMTSFGAGVLGNAVLARMYEDGKLSSVGLSWSNKSSRELLLGIFGGAGAAVLILLLALVSRMASFQSIPDPGASIGGVVFAVVLLFLGAFGEELMFHGYAFQLLTKTAGDYAALLPVGVLFGFAHLGNENVTFLAILNTIAWGILLGYGYLRTRALWLSIGLHFGWNAAQPLIGVNLSGFTIGMTGYELRWKAGTFWSGGAYGLEGGIFTTLVVIVLFILIHGATRRNEDLA